RVQLFVDRLVLHSTGGNGWTVSVRMVDADSGTPAPEFDAIVEAKDDSGHTVGPLTLTDEGTGQYSGPLTAAPGKWELAIKAETLPGGPPGVPLRKVYPVVLEPGKDVVVGARPPGGSGVGLALPIGAAVAIAAIVGWFFVSRRRRPSLVTSRRSGAV
ncbi:MAG: hypothetical protein ACRDYF_00460, partial [Acidimicrobiia bacterium]